jgi:hypothetical protein
MGVSLLDWSLMQDTSITTANQRKTEADSKQKGTELNSDVRASPDTPRRDRSCIGPGLVVNFPVDAQLPSGLARRRPATDIHSVAVIICLA